MSRPTDSSIVTKCANILDVLTSTRAPMTFSEIVQNTGLVKSSCHRILTVLQSEQLVDYDKSRRTYSTGPRLRGWARAGFEFTDLQTIAAEPMDWLSDTTRMNVALSVLDGDSLLYLRTSNHVEVRFAARPGDHAPLHCTAAGKVFLAFMSENRRQSVLGGGDLEKYTDFTCTDPIALDADLENVRDQKYSYVFKEEFLQVMGLSAPIWNDHGKVAACLSVWTLTVKHSLDDLLNQLEPLRQVAGDLCARSGGVAPN